MIEAFIDAAGLGLTVKAQTKETDVETVFVKRVNSEKALSNEQKERLRPVAEDLGKRTREKLDAFMNDPAIGSGMLHDAIVEICDADFTEAELEEITAFIRTVVGKKAASFMRGIVGRASKRSSERYGARLQAFVQARVREAMMELDLKIEEAISEKK